MPSSRQISVPPTAPSSPPMVSRPTASSAARGAASCLESGTAPSRLESGRGEAFTFPEGCAWALCGWGHPLGNTSVRTFREAGAEDETCARHSATPRRNPKCEHICEHIPSEHLERTCREAGAEGDVCPPQRNAAHEGETLRHDLGHVDARAHHVHV